MKTIYRKLSHGLIHLIQHLIRYLYRIIIQIGMTADADQIRYLFIG